ncbi:MAG: hypothetical protein ACYSUK_07195 [Planctomycetota bacterium]|jgi:hypothetical protein
MRRWIIVNLLYSEAQRVINIFSPFALEVSSMSSEVESSFTKTPSFAKIVSKYNQNNRNNIGRTNSKRKAVQ